MKALWKGSISFGLVTIPVKLYKATEERTVRFNQLHAPCNARIRQRRVCSACQSEVKAHEIARGYEYDTDCFVTLSDAELDRGVHARVISILKFMAPTEIDPIQYLASFYLGPDVVGSSAYRLLVEAMRSQGVVALATIAMRDKQRPAMLRLYGDVLVLHQLFWPDEIRSAALDHLAEGAEPRAQELSMASTLIGNLAGAYDPDELHDSYRERVEALVAAKVEGHEPPQDSKQEGATVLDLFAALKASIDASTVRAEGA